jgi:flagellar basal body-associated protein FliL
MASKRKLKIALLIGWLLIQAVAFAAHGFCAQPWSDSDWKKNTQDRNYSEQQEEEKEEENPFQPIEAASSEWQISEQGKLIILIIFIVFLIGLLVYFFLNKSSTKDSLLSSENLGMLELESRLIDIDPHPLLEKTIAAEDYKTAVRLLYLTLLRELHLKKHIEWKKDKTNRDFVREMRVHGSYEHFKKLTLAYEVIWYGESAIREDQFLKIKHQFDTFSLPNTRG